MNLELEIKHQVYTFRFGMGFLVDINETYTRDVPGAKQVDKIGLQYQIAGLIDRNPISLQRVLYTACIDDPKLTMADIGTYIEEVDDIEGLFQKVLDFLSESNCTSHLTKKMLKAVQEQEEEEKKRKEALEKIMDGVKTE